jgi:hypothetical protein
MTTSIRQINARSEIADSSLFEHAPRHLGDDSASVGFPLDTDPERYIRQQYGKRINEARLRLRSIV